MKKLIVLLSVIILSVGVGFAADPVEGYWISYDEKTGKPTAGWQIYQSSYDQRLYGKILSKTNKADVKASKCKPSYSGFPVAGDVSEMNVIGTPWIFGLTKEKDGYWSGGRIIDPTDGKMYKCKVTFHPAGGKYAKDTLEMRGEIGLGIGRSQYWLKASKAEAGAL
ncbi:MAG: DUF2147 domain-containing protein [Spirochaetia bacterium]|jgi:uncharacterized protein (DUF2147 family)|nr:DUF2147 domain-containing protein [Spirochaetia bacterium]